jgi:L-iditol 2-dehydrogenase
VVVAVRSVGVCGSDVHYYEHGRIGDFVVTSPLVLGHEASGMVVTRGDAATKHSVGQRVAIEPGVPCGACTMCRTGRYNLCPYVRFLATPPVDGAFVQYLAVHEDFAHAVPERISDDAAALFEPLSVAIWANHKAGTSVETNLLVTGAGPIGVLTAMVARASGAASVTLVEVDPARLAVAERLGVADVVIDARAHRDLREFEPSALIECTGAAGVVDAGIRSLRPAGTAVLVGMGAEEVQPLPTAVIQARELTVTATFRYANTYPTALALAASGRVDLDGLVGARLPLDEAEKALRMGRTHPEVLKTIVAVGD